jgi:transcriptional regulator with GAF, ATPase, and Fis domain
MGAISAELAERELFGNERGAYTDAKDARPGLFELANGGTLFLDEIGEAPLELQVKLLKVIEDGKFMRLGGNQVRQTSIKLICATNRDLESRVAANEFREDLFFRISTFPITIPALAERREDIPDIIASILPKCCADNNVYVTFDDLPKEFVDHLMNTPLRGNVREIEQNLSRLLVYAPKDRRGRPDFRRWNDIPGLTGKRSTKSGPHKSTLTMNDFLSLPFNVVGDEFPGLDAFVELVTDKVLVDAMSRHKTLKELSKALDVSISKLSTARRRIRSEGHKRTASPPQTICATQEGAIQ